MSTEVKSKSGQTGIRYLRSEHDRDRILNVFRHYDTGTFTLRDIKQETLPDMTSGEIARWSSAGILTCVGKTTPTKTRSSAKIWKLDGSVVSILTGSV